MKVRPENNMTPIDPDDAATKPGMLSADPDDAPTMIDTRFRRHLLARGVDDPFVDQDQMEAISFESSMATFAPSRHESAYFDEQPSTSMRLPAIQAAALPIGDEAIAEDEQPSTQMRALKGNAIATATMIITASFVVGRVLGLFRNSLFAALFGGPAHIVDADAYTQAFYIPDTIFNLVSGGALLSAFIPVFTQYLVEKRDKKTAYQVANIALFEQLFLGKADIELCLDGGYQVDVGKGIPPIDIVGGRSGMYLDSIVIEHHAKYLVQGFSYCHVISPGLRCRQDLRRYKLL